MNDARLKAIINDLATGAISADEAEVRMAETLRDFPFEDLGYARVDHHRALRQGFPEVVFGLGKTPEQVAGIAQRIVAQEHTLLVTRASDAAFAAVSAHVPNAEWHALPRCIVWRGTTPPSGHGTILVAAAGTSDLPVAEEAALTAELMGNTVDRLYDVGIAGLHRLLHARNRVDAARVIIVVAGMEGALPSVIGGLAAAPIIAVPTSVGYGASFGGLSALLGMLNSCAAGVCVVNIDNGFGAGTMASRINHL